MKRKKEALIFLSREPQIPIKKYIGINMLSKNIKKEIRSVATNERIRKSSKNKKHKQYSFKKIKCFL
jgi:hypothetical protein